MDLDIKTIREAAERAEAERAKSYRQFLADLGKPSEEQKRHADTLRLLAERVEKRAEEKAKKAALEEQKKKADEWQKKEEARETRESASEFLRGLL